MTTALIGTSCNTRLIRVYSDGSPTSIAYTARSRPSMNVTLILAGLSGSIVKMRTPESSASYAMADHLRRVLPSSAISHRCRASSIELASRTEAIGKSC